MSKLKKPQMYLLYIGRNIQGNTKTTSNGLKQIIFYKRGFRGCNKPIIFFKGDLNRPIFSFEGWFWGFSQRPPHTSRHLLVQRVRNSKRKSSFQNTRWSTQSFWRKRKTGGRRCFLDCKKGLKCGHFGTKINITLSLW